MDAGVKQTENLAATTEKPQVIVIAAQEGQTQGLRVAAYCRVSSDSSDQLNSYAAQVRHYTDLITSHPDWLLADIYADEGVTGTSAEKRADFQRLLADCRRGRIDIILVKSIARFARNTLHCLEAARELKDLGVSVRFENENLDTGRVSGEMLTAIFASFAQAESENISKSIRWSYQRRMEKGTYIPSSMPYGYVLRDGEITIDENQAVVIKRIFQDYLTGRNTADIAADLCAEGIPFRRNMICWNAHAIQYILANEKYAGNSIWQKFYTIESLSHRRRRNKGERLSYYAENTNEPIITQEEFNAAQELLAQRRRCLPLANKTPYPLRQKLYCHHCGSVFRRKVIRGTAYWSCMGHEKDLAFCPVTQIPETEIYAAFLRLYHKLKNHGVPILERMLEQLQEVRQKRFLWRADIVELNKRIAFLADRGRTLNELKLVSVLDPDFFISESNSLAAQLRAAKLEKERLLAAEEDQSIKQTRELLDILEDAPDFLPQFDGEVFTGLVEKIIVEPDKQLSFRLINGLELTKKIEKAAR